jgi:hypothetical protein
MKLKERYDKWLFLLIILVAFVLRVYNFNEWTYSNDELSALIRTNIPSISDFISLAILPDVHPPATQFMIHIWSSLFGDSVQIMRIPFLIFSLFSVYFAYLVGASWINKETGFLLSSVIAVFYFPVIYGVIARPYSLGLMSCLASSYYWIAYKNEKINIRKMVGFVFFTLLAMYTHHFALLFSFLLIFLGLAIIHPINLKKYIVSVAIIGLLFIPNLFILFSQLSKKGLNWLGKPEFDFVLEHFFLILNNSFMVIFIFGVSLLLGLIYAIKNKNLSISKIQLASLFLFLVPLIVGYLYSIFIQPVLQNSALLFSFPFFLMFIFSFFSFEKLIFPSVLFLILASGIYSTIQSNQLYNTNHFGVFEPLTEKLIQWQEEYGSNHITHTAHINSPDYFEYYFKNNNKKIAIPLTKIDTPENLKRLVQLTNDSTKKYFTFSRSSVATNPEIIDIILDRYPTIVEQELYFNSSASLFQKSTSSRSNLFQTKYQADETLLPGWTIHLEHQTFLEHDSINRVEKMDQNHIYSSIYEAELGQFNSSLSEIYVGCKLSAYCDNFCDATLVIHFVRGEETLFWYGVDVSNYIEKPNQWGEVYASREIPQNALPSDKVKVYIWNRSNQLYIDNFTISIYSKTNLPF